MHDQKTRRTPVALLLIAAASGCGGSGGGGRGTESPPQSQPGVLQLAAGSYGAGEADGTVTITVTRTEGSSGAASVVLATRDGTAVAGQDFTASSVTVSFAAGDTAPKLIQVAIADDAAVEATEAFTATLSGATGATLGPVAAATVTIADNDGGAPLPEPEFALNDTGVITCANGVSAGVSCDSSSGAELYPRQDGHLGRDVSEPRGDDGHAGFSFTKLDANGTPLPDQTVSYQTATWACVRDNVTGLVWEIKTDDDGLRDRDATFTWHNSSGILDGGEAGTPDGGVCAESGSCDTEGYVAQLRTALLCGRDDWRLPTRRELISVLNYGAAAAPFVDAAWIANERPAALWSADSDAFFAWAVHTESTVPQRIAKSAALPVRMVSGRSIQ